MKKLYFLILSLGVLFSCSGSRGKEATCQWPTTGVAEADSLVPKLQHAFDNGASSETIVNMLDGLNKLKAENSTNDLVYALYGYWRSRLLAHSGEYEEANNVTLDAMARIDSVQHTYYYYKLRSELERTMPSIGYRYRIALENLSYFRSVGDSMSVAHTLVTIGNLLRPINEFEKAEAVFRQACDIWKAAGKERNYVKNQINIALCLQGEAAEKLNRELIKSPIIKADTAAYTLLLRNMATYAYENEDGEASLKLSQEGLDVIGKSNKFAANAAILHSIRGIEMLRRNEKTEALYSARKALELSDGPIEKYAVFFLLHSAAKVFYSCNLMDSAELLLNQALEVRSDREFELNNITLSIEESRQALMQLQFAAELHAVRQQQLWFAIVSGLIIIMLCIAFVLNKKINVQRIKEQEAQQKLKESQSRLAREALMFEQNESLIDRLKKEIEKERENGHISHTAATQLLSTLGLHIADRAERQAFIDIHDCMLPDFSAKLKAQYPDLTEHQIKLAAYISAGMSNAVIAKLLNITPASVRTLRYRMRSKFNLERNDSLEDFLRRYAT